MPPDSLEQRVNSFAGGCRYVEERDSARIKIIVQCCQALGFVERVNLVRDRDDRLLREPLSRRVAPRKQLELAGDHGVILNRIASARGGDIHQMDEHFRPFEMAQEAVPETVA